jgi:hypothetical protein
LTLHAAPVSGELPAQRVQPAQGVLLGPRVRQAWEPEPHAQPVWARALGAIHGRHWVLEPGATRPSDSALSEVLFPVLLPFQVAEDEPLELPALPAFHFSELRASNPLLSQTHWNGSQVAELRASILQSERWFLHVWLSIPCVLLLLHALLHLRVLKALALRAIRFGEQCVLSPQCVQIQSNASQCAERRESYPRFGQLSPHE